MGVGPCARVRIPFDEHYWDTVAERVFQRNAEGPLRVLLPSTLQGGPLRAAMASRMQANGAAMAAIPRITTLADWIADAVSDHATGPIASDTSRRLALFDALRGNSWIARGFAGGGPAAMWSMARHLVELGDDLSRAAYATLADPERFRAAVASHFRGRAHAVGSPEAELVLGVWRAAAGNASDPVAAQVRAMQGLVDRAAESLIVVRAIGPQASHEAEFLLRYGERAPVEVIEVDVAASLSAHPSLLAAWPELGADGDRRSDQRGTLFERARALATREPSGPHLAFVGAASLEEEATAAASQIVHWLAMTGPAAPRRIALIALDRRVARRVRALLERARVVPVDESGWRLSTTTAAGALMRWLDLASPEGGACESAMLLDWIKSGFAWGDLDEKSELVATIEHAIRAANVSRGWQAIIDAIDRSPRSTTEQRRHARMHVRRLHTLATVARGRDRLSVFFEWLRRSLAGNGMDIALRGDRVGAKVLDVVESLAEEVDAPRDVLRAAGARDRRRDARDALFAYAEWRGLIADALEATTVRDMAIDSPVVFASLSAAALRPFDGVVVVGADAGHFPVRAADAFFLTPGLRSELGLGRRDEQEAGELATLAVVLAQARRALVTWQAEAGGEARLPAPAIGRLLQVERMASAIRDGGQAPRTHRFAWDTSEVQPSPVEQPGPCAPGLLPSRISASQANAFVSCPYRYYARAMLGLAALDEVSDEAGKRDYGEVVHGILEAFHREWSRRGTQADPRAEDARREQCLRDLSEAMFAERIAANPDYLAWRARWMPLVPRYVAWWRKWTDQGWRFAEAEVERQLILEIDAQWTLTLRGRVDRVDRHVDGRRMAILDYKARRKEDLRNELAEPGEDVQLPFYRLLLRGPQDEQETVLASYLSVDRARVDRVSPEQALDPLSQAVADRLIANFRDLREGAPMRAQGIEQVCRRCDMRGICRRGAWAEIQPSVGGST